MFPDVFWVNIQSDQIKSSDQMIPSTPYSPGRTRWSHHLHSDASRLPPVHIQEAVGAADESWSQGLSLSASDVTHVLSQGSTYDGHGTRTPLGQKVGDTRVTSELTAVHHLLGAWQTLYDSESSRQGRSETRRVGYAPSKW